MHYHMELIMPPTSEVKETIEKYMQKFSENNEDARHGFWDWYRIGGRYSGAKVEALYNSAAMEAFYAELKASKVTVSAFQFGKQELSPPEQREMVDAMWLRHFPDSPIRSATMFKHSGEEIAPMDICNISAIPENLTAYTVLICGPSDPVTLLHKSIWNGCTHQDTDWKGNVHDALVFHTGKLEIYSDEYKAKVTVAPDWLCVTIDYHS